MTQDAIVTRLLENGFAEVTVRRTSACGGACDTCGAACGAPPITAVAVNEAGAATGDRVVIESAAKSVLGAAVLVYIVPLALFLLGYILSGAFALTEAASVVVSIGGFLAGALIVYLVNKKLTKSKKILYRIVSIAKNG